MQHPFGAPDRRWRILFSAAGAYNIVVGCWAILAPHGFFDLFELDQPKYPSIWSCVGMVIGVYGLGYLYAAWRPAAGGIIVALGLIGKVLGPIGWLMAVSRQELPPRTFPIILFNDLVWWFPFIAYLLRHRRNQRMFLSLGTVVFHLLACIALLLSRRGTDLEPDHSMRLSFIRDHVESWTVCWFLWSAASLSLLTFFVCWGGRLIELGVNALLVCVGVCLCAIGLCFDLTSQLLAIRLANSNEHAFSALANQSMLLGAGVANGLYCIAGLLLWALGYRAAFQRGPLAIAALIMWCFGIGLSATAFAGNGWWMAMTGGALMCLFIPWTAITTLMFRYHHGTA